MNKPFTLAQAIDIAEDFSDLEDTGLIVDIGLESISCHIQKVAVVPYPTTEKEMFINKYKTDKNALTALKQYKGSEYEVLILATNNANNEDVVTMSIGEYTSKYGVKYRYS